MRVVAVMFFALLSTPLIGQIRSAQSVFRFHKDVCPKMTDRVQVQNRISGNVNAAVAQRYPFLIWSTKEVKGAPAFIVALELIATGNGITYHLRYYRDVGVFKDAMPKVKTGDELYEPDEGKEPCTDPDLGTRVFERVGKDLDEKRYDFQDDFFGNIVLSDKVPEGVSDEETIAVGLLWVALKAASGSKIRVVVKDKLKTELLKAELMPIDRHGTEVEPDSLVCALVDYFSAQGLPRWERWDPRIPGVLEKLEREHAEVVLARYEANPDAAATSGHKAKKTRFVQDH